MSPLLLTRRICTAIALSMLAACAGTTIGDSDFADVPDFDHVEHRLREPSDRMIVVAVANPRVGITLEAGSTLAPYAGTQRYMAGSSARATLRAIEQEHGLTELAAWPIRALGLHCVVLEVAAGVSRDAVIAALTRDARVEIAQPLQSFGTLGDAAGRYNDPYAELQRGFVEIDAAQAHRTSRGAGVLIAVIDTGADTAHPDLQGRIARTRNFVDRDGGRFRRDRHGTQVAGIIAAVADNHLGIVGVAPEARLAIYKACWQNGEASDKTGDRTSDKRGARCNSFTLALALAAAIDDGARIINLSLGGPPDELLSRLVARALQRGCIVVAAMPPDGSSAGFPAGVAGVFAVDMAEASRAGRGVFRAPGRDILTLEPDGRYDFDSGSSLAAAHVSAAAALLLGADPQLSAATVRALLMRSHLSLAAGDSINACGALAELGGGAACVSTRAATRPPQPSMRAVSHEPAPRDARLPH